MDVKTLSALAEPNRLRIIELLKVQPRSVNEIAHLLELRQPQASKHLHTLNQAGLVNVQPVAQQRIYRLNQEAFLQLDNWVDSFNQYWTRRLDTLDTYLNNPKKG